jgi:hypothetical protein
MNNEERQSVFIAHAFILLPKAHTLCRVYKVRLLARGCLTVGCSKRLLDVPAD